MKKHSKTKSLNINTTNPNNISFSNGKNKRYIITTYQTKHKQRSKPKTRSDSETKRIGKTYLDELYENYSNNLKQYLNKNKYGLRFLGNEVFKKYSLSDYQLTNTQQIDKIKAKMEEMKLAFITPNNYTELKGKSSFTPIPLKSKQFINTKKESNELRVAERSAVMMRIYEYAYDRTSEIAIMEIYKKESEEKQRTILYLKKVVNKIEDWWRKVKLKQFESSERFVFNNNQANSKRNNLQEQAYAKCAQLISEKKKAKGFEHMLKLMKRVLYPVKKLFFGKIKLRLENKELGYKVIKRKIDNWFNKSGVIRQCSFSIIDKIITYKKRVINKGMRSIKKAYNPLIQMWIVVILQRFMRDYLKRKETERIIAQASIKKPLITIGEMNKLYRGQAVDKVRWLSRLMHKKLKIANYYVFNDLFINPIYNHDSHFDINNHIDTAIIFQFNSSQRLRSSGYNFPYFHSIMRYFIKKWKATACELTKAIESKSYCLALKCLLLSLSIIRTNNLHWAYNSINRRKKSIDTCARFSSFIRRITGKRLISTLSRRILSKQSSKILTKFLVRRLIGNTITRWTMKNKNVHYFSEVIKLYSIELSKNLFFNNLSQMDKNAISVYSEVKSNETIDDNAFRYYCYVNRADNQSDYKYMRVSLGLKLLVSFIIRLEDLINVLKLIKSKRKKKGVNATLPWDNIHLNPRASSKWNQFKATIQKIDLILVKRHKSDFFHRIVLNHLVSALKVNNQELISLLKSGTENAYQEVFNKILELNLTSEGKRNSNDDIMMNVQKFIAETTK